MMSEKRMRSAQRVSQLLLILLFALIAAGCTPTSLLGAMRLGSGGPTRIIVRETVVETLFAQTPAELLHVQQGSVYLSLYCQIAEGTMCYRVPYAAVEAHTNLDPSLRTETSQIERELIAQLFIRVFWADPWKYVEQAQFNAVRVRCYRPEMVAAPIQCRVGFGRGWEPALVF